MTTITPLMEGKKGLIMGLANDKSIAWGIAKNLNSHGAQIAISYQNEALEKRVIPLADQLDNDPILIKCDVTDSASGIIESTSIVISSV
jgi:enoyl-[acyl-carrier protein] reductase I